MSDDVKRIDIAEFRSLGFLQEANRQFFHPLGLALEVAVEQDGSEHLAGIWDYRDDPEGVLYGGDLDVNPSYVAMVEAERKRHVKAREALLGEGQTVQGA